MYVSVALLVQASFTRGLFCVSGVLVLNVNPNPNQTKTPLKTYFTQASCCAVVILFVLLAYIYRYFRLGINNVQLVSWPHCCPEGLTKWPDRHIGFVCKKVLSTIAFSLLS